MPGAAENKRQESGTILTPQHLLVIYCDYAHICCSIIRDLCSLSTMQKEVLQLEDSFGHLLALLQRWEMSLPADLCSEDTVQPYSTTNLSRNSWLKRSLLIDFHELVLVVYGRLRIKVSNETYLILIEQSDQPALITSVRYILESCGSGGHIDPFNSW